MRPIYRRLRMEKSHISIMEKQALLAGNAGFERGLFTGRPNWSELRALSPLNLTEEEKFVLNGPVEELCRRTEDFDIRFRKKEIPHELWEFMKKHKLFGLRVPKSRGGYSLSFQAQSLILGKIASRSVDVATMVELPTSLWPDEIVEKYGTEEQKNYYMPRFADSKEIVAFAITGISNGSDATAMRDIGRVEWGQFEGKKVLGIRLKWQKRYITFAPKATLLAIGFQLEDPENLLNKGKNIGITMALIPANHPGISIGRRHLPTNVAFPNGPIWGENVFIPIDWVLGGEKGMGQGWKMIMECLFVGRAMALPAISVAAVKLALRTSSQYARVRRQFGSPIGTFEGIEEPLVRLIEAAYFVESARVVTSAMVDKGDRPLAVSSLMKYKTTQYAREAVNDAMDIHAGRAVMDGPSNYLMSTFLAAPIGVSVEGANIVTRSIITFAQGVLQTHPYFYEELESCEEPTEEKGLERFSRAFKGHLIYLITNICRTVWHSLTLGVFLSAPRGVPRRVKSWYRKIGRWSISFATISDITVLLLGSSLKKKQKLSGRMADTLSELFLLSSVLKRFEDDGFPESDYPIVELCMRNGLSRLKSNLSLAIRNFPLQVMRPILSILIFPYGRHLSTAPDSLGHKVAELVLVPGSVLDGLTRYIYLSDDPNDITGRLEVAFKKAVEVEPAQKKLDRAIRAGKIKRVLGVDWVKEAVKLEILTPEEGKQVRFSEALAEKAMNVDDFDYKEISPGSMPKSRRVAISKKREEAFTLV